jgi:hypothetical protein
MKNKDKVPFFLSVVITSSWIGGCTSLPYLHSNETEIATQAIKEAASNIKVDQTFLDIKKQLASFATREDQAVTDYLLASRDQQFASLVRDSVLVKEKDTAITRLNTYVDSRFKIILGTNAESNTEFLEGLRKLPTQYSLVNEGLETSYDYYLSAKKQFIDLKDPYKRPTDCKDVPEPIQGIDPVVSGQNVDIVYSRIKGLCATIRRVSENYKNHPIRTALSGKSDLLNVFKQIDDAQTSIASEKEKKAKIERLIDEIERLSVSEPDSDNIKNKIAEARNILTGAAGFAKLGGATRLSQSLEEILAAILETTNSELSTKQETTTNSTGSSATPITQKAATNETTSGSGSKITQKTAAAILALIDSLTGSKFKDQPQIQQVNSILIGLVEQRQKRDVASLDINRQLDLLQIYKAKQAALLQELAQLASIKLILNKVQKNISLNGEGGGFAVISPGTKEPSPAVSFMLAAYSASWNQGQIPYQILRFKEVQVERAYHVDVAASTARNRKDMLTPALEELAAYGKGGIHPETIATLITNVGLIAAFAAR